MNINFNNQNAFTSRNSTIRFADDIVRKVNNEYPRISSTKLQSLSNVKKYDSVLQKVCRQLKAIRTEIATTMDKDTQAYSQVKSILKLIKEQKVGNCSEASFLALISARVNGIKNCVTAYITSPKGFNYDHSIILVEDEKPYIIDAWLGFADYVPNAIKRYQKDFRNCFDFREAKTNEMLIKQDEYSIFAYFNEEFNKKDMRKIKKIVPSLILNKD